MLHYLSAGLMVLSVLSWSGGASAQSLPDQFFFGCMETCDAGENRVGMRERGMDPRAACTRYCGCNLSHIEQNYSMSERMAIYGMPISQISRDAMASAIRKCSAKLQKEFDRAEQSAVAPHCRETFPVPPGSPSNVPGRLGVTVDNPYVARGASLVSVDPDGPSRDRLQVGVTILSINNIPVNSPDDLITIISTMQAGSVVVVCGVELDPATQGSFRQVVAEIELGPR